MQFGFVAKRRRIRPVELACKAPDVARSGFYAWLTRAPCQASRDDEPIGALVRQSFIASDRTYDTGCVWRDVLLAGDSMRSSRNRAPGAFKGL